MTTVAVLGANGVLGAPIVAALSSAPGYSYPIIVVTRDASKAPKATEKVKYVQGSPDDEGSLETIFKGVDVVINVSSVKANWDAVLDAVKAAKVKVYVPSEFGVDYTQQPEFHFLDLKKNHLAAARAVPGLKTVAVQTGVFGEFTVNHPSFLRLDPATNKADPINPDAVWTTTFITDIAAALAVLLAKPVKDIPDVVNLQGQKLSFREYYNLYGEKKGVKVDIVPFITIPEARKQVAQNEKDNKWGDSEFLLYLHLLQAEEKAIVPGTNNDLIKNFKTINDATFA